MPTFFQRNALLVLLAAVFAAAAVFYGVGVSSQSTETASQLQEIAELEAQMQTALDAAESEQRNAVDGTLGTSEERIAADTPIIRQFVSTAVTWESGEEYSAARESLIRLHQLDEGSQFLTSYFQAPTFNTDSSGNRYYLIDTEGMNSHLSSLEVKVMGVSGTEYRYMVLADIGASSNDGKASASRTSVIYLTLDGEGRITDVSGYAAGSRPLASK